MKVRKHKKKLIGQYDEENRVRRHRADPSTTGAIKRIAEHFRSSAGATVTNIKDRKSKRND